MKFVRASNKQFGIVVAITTGVVVFCGCKSDSSGAKSSKSNNASLSPEQSHQTMVEHLAKIAAASKTESTYFGSDRREKLLQQVESSKGKASARMLLTLGDAEMNLGMEKEAIAHFEQALDVVKEGDEKGVQRSDVLYWLGVGNLRLAETENCCAQNTPDSCILPIRGEGIHTRKDGSRKAMNYFSEVLQTTFRKSETHVRAKWLLNIAAMTLGEFPSSVPYSDRVDPDYFTSEVVFPRFKNISKKLGLNTFSCAGGAIVDDFDNDGDFDVAVSDSNPGGQLCFYRNRGEDGFVDETEAANLSLLLRPVSRAVYDAAAGALFDPRWDLPPDTLDPPRRDKPSRRLVVMLDPGHGGIDPGAENRGIKEADLMLLLARELKDTLLRTGDYDVLLTREADVFVSLEDRVRLAHQRGADVFISLHADALAHGVAHGARIFTLSDAASDAASAALAERHDRLDILSGIDLNGADDVVTDVLLDLARLETGCELST